MHTIGLMSGTSMDGVDAALLHSDGLTSIHPKGHIHVTYPPSFKKALKAAELTVRSCFGDLKKAEALYPLREVIAQSTQYHLEAVQALLQKTGFQAKDIAVIGYHGQTLWHCPALKQSVIVGDGQYLADQIKITVVADFRTNDIQHGGLGAPFAPLYHHALAMQQGLHSVAVVNCGGIANITVIQGDNPESMLAFDTGPGNALIDALVREQTHQQEYMDEDGRYGLKGQVQQPLIVAMYERAIIRSEGNYFLLPPPKALDIGDMRLLPEFSHLSLPDACATLEYFTAHSIVDSVKYLPKMPDKWVLAGGGWQNPVIKGHLIDLLGTSVEVLAAEALGWNSQALEAELFAYLAVRSLKGYPLSLPNTTDVPYPMLGGVHFSYAA